MLRRPLKPFAVEVRRGKKNAAQGASAFPLKAPPPAPTVAAPILATPVKAEAAKPPRRILEAIEPTPAPEPVLAEPAAEIWAEPSAPDASSPKTSLPKAAALKPRRIREANVVRIAAPERRRPVDVFVEPVAERAAEIVVPVFARPSEKKKTTFHAARVEESASLKRGERWKRRLPKVLW